MARDALNIQSTLLVSSSPTSTQVTEIAGLQNSQDSRKRSCLASFLHLTAQAPLMLATRSCGHERYVFDSAALLYPTKLSVDDRRNCGRVVIVSYGEPCYPGGQSRRNAFLRAYFEPATSRT